MNCAVDCISIEIFPSDLQLIARIQEIQVPDPRCGPAQDSPPLPLMLGNEKPDVHDVLPNTQASS